MKKVKFFNINIITLTVTHFLWSYVNYVFTIQIQPFILSIYGTEQEAAQILGIILSLASFSALIPLLLAFLADSYGRRNLIVIGEVFSLIGLVGLSFFSHTIWISVLSILVFNVGLGMYDAPLQGLIKESSLKNRVGTAYAIIYNSAYIAGIIAAIVIQFDGNETIIFQFLLGAILLAISITINLVSLRDILPRLKKISFPLKKILKKPNSRLLATAFFLDGLTWGITISIANGVYIILFDVDASYLATLVFVQTLVMVLLQYPAGFIVDRFGRLSGLLLGELFSIFYLFLIQMALIFSGMALNLIIIAYIFIGIAATFWMPSMTLSFISIDTEAASTNYGILAFIQRLGWAPTAAIGGFIFANWGYSPALVITFVFTLLVTLIFLKINKMEKREQELAI